MFDFFTLISVPFSLFLDFDAVFRDFRVRFRFLLGFCRFRSFLFRFCLVLFSFVFCDFWCFICFGLFQFASFSLFSRQISIFIRFLPFSLVFHRFRLFLFLFYFIFSVLFYFIFDFHDF